MVSHGVFSGHLGFGDLTVGRDCQRRGSDTKGPNEWCFGFMFCDVHGVCVELGVWMSSGNMGAEMKDVGTLHSVDLGCAWVGFGECR